MFKINTIYGKIAGDVEFVTLHTFDESLGGYADYFNKILISPRGITVVFHEMTTEDDIEDDILEDLSHKMPMNYVFIPFGSGKDYDNIINELRPFWTYRLPDNQVEEIKKGVLGNIVNKLKKFYKLVDTH